MEGNICNLFNLKTSFSATDSSSVTFTEVEEGARTLGVVAGVRECPRTRSYLLRDEIVFSDLGGSKKKDTDESNFDPDDDYIREALEQNLKNIEQEGLLKNVPGGLHLSDVFRGIKMGKREWNRDEISGAGDNAFVNSNKISGAGDNAFVNSNKIPGGGDNAFVNSNNIWGAGDNVFVNSNKISGAGDNAFVNSYKISGVGDSAFVNSNKISGTGDSAFVSRMSRNISPAPVNKNEGTSCTPSKERGLLPPVAGSVSKQFTPESRVHEMLYNLHS